MNIKYRKPIRAYGSFIDGFFGIGKERHKPKN